MKARPIHMLKIYMKIDEIKMHIQLQWGFWMLCPNMNYKQNVCLNIHRLKHCAIFYFFTWRKKLFETDIVIDTLFLWMIWQQLGDQTSCLFDLRSRIRCTIAKHEIKKKIMVPLKSYDKSQYIMLWILWVGRWQICI